MRTLSNQMVVGINYQPKLHRLNTMSCTIFSTVQRILRVRILCHYDRTHRELCNQLPEVVHDPLTNRGVPRVVETAVENQGGRDTPTSQMGVLNKLKV